MNMMQKAPAISKTASAITGKAAVPGDKSISHRSLIISSIFIGETTISGLLEGEDVINTAKAMQAFGSTISKENSDWSVKGMGYGGLLAPRQVLDFGNSGTGSRLIMGLAATHPFNTFMTGDASLCKRPMRRVTAPLQELGAKFTTSSGDTLPLVVTGTINGLPLTHEMKVASAQVKSAIMLAATNIAGTTTIIEKEGTRDHTERMLRFFGVQVEESQSKKGKSISLNGRTDIQPSKRHIIVPGDPSSAAFLVVAALICKGSKLEITNICLNKYRTGLFETLIEMGAKIEYRNLRESGGEPVGDLHVEYSELKGINVPAERAPSMIDEYPILAIAAAFANGKTCMNGLAELKVKESNRLTAIAEGLQECGVKISMGDDDLTVYGTGKAAEGGGLVSTRMDHRIAMAFLVMGMASKSPVKVDDTAFIATSFPGFVELMNGLGANITAFSERRNPLEKHHRTAPKLEGKPIIVAIDGPAASGKGTLGRRVAEAMGVDYLDTGSLYRAVGLKLVYSGKDPHDVESAVKAAQDIDLSDLSNPRLRQEKVGNAASIVAAIPEVRAELLNFQRKFATSGNGAVLDGRDIGTVVCPDADVKVFITASINARSKRRHRELQGQGIEVVFASVLRDLEERDERDRKRDIAPMRPAKEALVIDTTNLSANEVFEKIMELVKTAKKL